MKYEIKPQLFFVDEKLSFFSGDIAEMDLELINDGIESCIDVLNGDSERLSWGLEISEVLICKEFSTLTCFSQFVANIPTIELYNMLKEYRDALTDWMNKKAPNYKYNLSTLPNLKIDYFIRPILYIEDRKLWLLRNEIYELQLFEIQNGVNCIWSVINGNSSQIDWTLKLSNIVIRKEISILEKKGQFIAEISTKELYDMLKDYLDALIEYENRYKK